MAKQLSCQKGGFITNAPGHATQSPAGGNLPMELTGQSKNSIILSLSHLMLKQGKRYCFPSQAKLCEILTKYYHNPIHRRALNYHLRHLEDRGYISRKRRIKRGPDGKMIFASTLYFLTKRGYKFLARLANLSKKLKGFFLSSGTDRKHKLSKAIREEMNYNLVPPPAGARGA